MEARLCKQIYCMADEDSRKAEIVFEDGHFLTCSYIVSSVNNYTLDDWKFLKEVASEVERLSLSYEVGREK